MESGEVAKSGVECFWQRGESFPAVAASRIGRSRPEIVDARRSSALRSGGERLVGVYLRQIDLPQPQVGEGVRRVCPGVLNGGNCLRIALLEHKGTTRVIVGFR
jgi:hypothetical protein